MTGAGLALLGAPFPRFLLTLLALAITLTAVKETTMKKRIIVLAIALIALLLIAPLPSAEATRAVPHTRYRCEPTASKVDGICRLQYRKCVVAKVEHRKPVRHCTPWRYVAWA